jgi:ribokinase
MRGWIADALADLGDEVLHALCRRLGVPTVMLTLGARGVLRVARCGRDARRHRRVLSGRPKRSQANAIDTTGAGDAFSGSLAAALCFAANRPFRDAVQHANRVAGLSVETPGAALAMPTRAAVSSRFDR